MQSYSSYNKEGQDVKQAIVPNNGLTADDVSKAVAKVLELKQNHREFTTPVRAHKKKKMLRMLAEQGSKQN